MEKKIGAYICTGCAIGECLDTEKLAQIATQEFKAPVVRTSPAFCLEDIQLIQDDIEKGRVNSLS